MSSRVFDYIAQEEQRQQTTVELIASENFVSADVLRAVGSCLTNKYSEGYPARRALGNQGRYYGGCAVVGELEEYCIARWKEVFHTDYHVNVQPHSGSSANLAAYFALLQPGDSILSMSLSNGAHLTHGSPVNFSGKLYDMAMIQKFINEQQVEINSILAGVNGAMSFSLKRAELTAVTPEIGGPESITQSIEGQSTGNQYQSSIVIQRISYA